MLPSYAHNLLYLGIQKTNSLTKQDNRGIFVTIWSIPWFCWHCSNVKKGVPFHLCWQTQLAVKCMKLWRAVRCGLAFCLFCGSVFWLDRDSDRDGAAACARAWISICCCHCQGQLRPTVMAGVNYRDADTLKLQVKENEKVLTVTLCWRI